jgi:acetylornithine deacetylase
MNADPASQSQGLLAELALLCAADSTSGREDALLPPLRRLLDTLGATLVEQPVAPGRTNVLALWGKPRVLFSTHLDTVPPFLPPVLAGETLRGRGACDAKGQIVAQLEAIRRLRAEGHEGFAWLGVVGEETDSLGAIAALDLAPHFAACRALINGEPTGNRLATGQRGVLHLRLTCLGRAAHSGSPELGHSAAWPLLDWLQALRALPLRQDPELGSEVWNLGLVSAGEAINTVPAEATADLLARLAPGSAFAHQAAALAPAEGRMEVCLEEPADHYPTLPGFDHAPMPFGSDAPRLRDLIPDRTVVLAGPGSIACAHRPDEQITLGELQAGIALNHRLALHFLGGAS